MGEAINLTAIIISTIALIVALAALAMTIGIKLSTHRIEWRPLEKSDPLDELEEELHSDQEEDEELINKAKYLASEAKKKKEKDPLDEVLESSNF